MILINKKIITKINLREKKGEIEIIYNFDNPSGLSTEKRFLEITNTNTIESTKKQLLAMINNSDNFYEIDLIGNKKDTIVTL